MPKRGLKRLPPSELRIIDKEAARIIAIVRKRRESLGLTQEDLAERIDVSLDTIKAIELGYRFASLPVLIRVCRALKLKISITNLDF